MPHYFINSKNNQSFKKSIIMEIHKYYMNLKKGDEIQCTAEPGINFYNNNKRFGGPGYEENLTFIIKNITKNDKEIIFWGGKNENGVFNTSIVNPHTKIYSIEELKNNSKIVIHTETQDEYLKVKKLISWKDDYWNIYKSTTCLNVSIRGIQRLNYYKDENKIIIKPTQVKEFNSLSSKKNNPLTKGNYYYVTRSKDIVTIEEGEIIQAGGIYWVDNINESNNPSNDLKVMTKKNPKGDGISSNEIEYRPATNKEIIKAGYIQNFADYDESKMKLFPYKNKISIKDIDNGYAIYTETEDIYLKVKSLFKVKQSWWEEKIEQCWSPKNTTFLLNRMLGNKTIILPEQIIEWNEESIEEHQYPSLNYYDNEQKILAWTELYHGMSVKCKIENDIITDAKISITNNKIYICQNFKDGTKTDERLGYNFSWIIKENNYRYADYLLEQVSMLLPTDSNTNKNFHKEQLKTKEESFYMPQIYTPNKTSKININVEEEVIILRKTSKTKSNIFNILKQIK